MNDPEVTMTRTRSQTVVLDLAREADVQLRLLAGAGAIDSRQAATALDLLDQVRAIAWRHLNPLR